MSGRHAAGKPDCRMIFERLSEYIDGELPRDLCSRIDGHLDDCPPCKAFLASLERTVRLVERVENPRLPDEIRRSVREAYARYRRDVE